jgi:hypothetical protein
MLRPPAGGKRTSVSSDRQTGKRRTAAVVVVSVVLVFALLAVLVSWPWHHGAWTRADLDLAAQRHAHDQATADFCVAVTKVKDGSQQALIAVSQHDVPALSTAVASVNDGFTDARSAAGGLPHVDDVAPLRRALDSIRAETKRLDEAKFDREPLTNAFVHMSLAAKLEGARAGCPTFSG